MRIHPPHLRLAASNGRLSCEAENAARPSFLASLKSSPVELLALQVLRHLCDSLATQETGGWEKAHQVAEAALPTGDAASLVAKCAALLRAIRRERPGRFSYLSADCPACSRRISADEQAVMLLIRAARENAARLTELAVDFTAGHDASGICAAVAGLGQTLVMIESVVEHKLPPRENDGVVVLHPAHGDHRC